MSVSNGNKIINKQTLDCSEKATVTISFDAKSELIARPADIILIMDKSSSMSGTRMDEAKKGAKELIDLVTLASGGVIDNQILNNSRVGIVSFAREAEPLVNLTNDTALLKQAIDSIIIGGNTNHEDAFIKAYDMVDKQSTNDKIIIMFTDGKSTAGGDATIQANRIKQEGISIYGILFNNNRTQIDSWVSDPIDTHVAVTTELDKIQEIFKKIAYEVIKAGAKDVIITEKLNKDFKIVDILNVTPGNVDIKDLQTLEWNMNAVGITDNDQAKLEFEIQYIGNESKTTNVNESLIFKDRDNTLLTFPNPSINVTCNTTVIVPDSCNNSTTMVMDGCKDAQSLVVLETAVQDLGRIVQVDVPIKNVCPNKRLGLAVFLTEVDTDGIEHNRGMKTVLINPIVSDKCENILVKCVNFVVPEALDMTGNTDSLCNDRTFKARVLVNYIDTDYVCCASETVIVK